MLKKILNTTVVKKAIYAVTDKPQHYVHVDKPTSLQDCRQIQYNKWSKAKRIYSGSYLPEDPNTLLQKGKGWKYATKHEGNKQNHKQYQRKSSKQVVRFDEDKINRKGLLEEKHYHWQVGETYVEQRTLGNKKSYFDRYGNLCDEGADAYHLAPDDKDYKMNKGGKK